MPEQTQADLRKALKAIARDDEKANVARFYKGTTPGSKVLGVSIGKVFPIAKAFTDLPLEEVEALLEDDHYEIRMAAVAILDFKARARKITPAGRKALYDLYLRRHDRIDTWDLVDRAAPHVIGEYLKDKNRKPLHKLAASPDPWRRRTAIVSTWAFIRTGETKDTFEIAGLLAGDAHPYVQLAIASWAREAGKRDPEGLAAFLAAHKGRLPKKTLRDASK